MRKLSYNDAQEVQTTIDDGFSSFWKNLNVELTSLGFNEALFGDVRDFRNWRPFPTPAEAAHHVLKLRGER